MYAWKKLLLTVTVAPIALLGCATAPDGARPLSMLGDAIKPGSATAAHERGKQYFADGQFGLALQQFQAALIFDPASVNTLNALGATYDRMGRFDLAQRSYRQALAVEPQSAQTLNNLGYSYMLQGKYDLAAVFLRDARTADHADALVARNLELAEAKLTEGPAAAPMAEVATAPITPADPTDPNTPTSLTVVAAPPRARIERTTAAVQVLVTGLLPADQAAEREGPLPTIHNAAPAPRTAVGEPRVAIGTGQIAGFAGARANADAGFLLATPQRTPEANPPRAADEAAVTPVEARKPVAGPGPRLISAPAAPQMDVALEVAAPTPVAQVEATQRPSPRVEIAALTPAPAPQAEVVHVVTAVPTPTASVQATPPRIEVTAAPTSAARVEAAQKPVPHIEMAALSPAAAPIKAAPQTAPVASALPGPVLEVSNGAGRLRMATRMRDHLAEQGILTTRLTNAENFRHSASTIYYRPGWEDAAAKLAARLPVAPKLVVREQQIADLRLELGGDLLDFDRVLILAARKNPKILAG